MLDILWQKSAKLWQGAKYLKLKESIKHFLLKYELNARELNAQKMLVQRSQSLFCHVRFRQKNRKCKYRLRIIHRYRRRKIDCSSLFTVPATSAAQNSLLFFFFLLRLLTELISKQGRP
jgi:hypothetical protein